MGLFLSRVHLASRGSVMPFQSTWKFSYKTKFFTATSPADGSSIDIPHLLDKAKIVSVDVLITSDTGSRMSQNYTKSADHEYQCYISGTNIRIQLEAGNSSEIDNNAITVLIRHT